MNTQKLSELAKTIRSKNAGVNKITFDIIFREPAQYERVKRSGAITRESMAALYRIPVERISDFVEYDPGLAIKFTVYRLQPSGSAGDAVHARAWRGHDAQWRTVEGSDRTAERS
mgnify:CR=1 FL=1